MKVEVMTVVMETMMVVMMMMMTTVAFLFSGLRTINDNDN